MKEPIVFSGFEGHLILFCKGHYDVNEVSRIDALQRIWAVRCGYDVDNIDDSSLEYIADDLYRILRMCKNTDSLVERLHREICKTPFFNYEMNLSPIERIILFYCNEIAMIKIKDWDMVNEKYIDLVKLPEPQKELFIRFIKGEFEFSDYKKVV